MKVVIQFKSTEKRIYTDVISLFNVDRVIHIIRSIIVIRKGDAIKETKSEGIHMDSIESVVVIE